MSSTAEKYGATVNTLWTSYANATGASDGAYATYDVPKDGTSGLLLLTNFGFTSSDIPAGATINGIYIDIYRCGVSSATYIFDSSLYLQLSGSNIGSNLASATVWPALVAHAYYGGPTNMCGTSLTQANIVDSSFGIGLIIKNTSAAAALSPTGVDDIGITVYYTAGTSDLNITASECIGANMCF